MVAGRNSALTAVGRLRSIGQQSAAYLPFSLSRSRTTAFPFGECVLRAHCGHGGWSDADIQRLTIYSLTGSTEKSAMFGSFKNSIANRLLACAAFSLAHTCTLICIAPLLAPLNAMLDT